MIERMQIRLQKYFKEHTAYLIVYWSYVAITIIPILLVGYLFNVLPFVIISSILGNELIRYTYGFHQTDNIKCFFFTNCMLIIFGYISITIPTGWLFLIGLFCMRDVYLKAPIKLTMENKTREWHEDKITLILAFYMLISIVGLYFKLTIITNSVLASIILVDLTLFLNKRGRG